MGRICDKLESPASDEMYGVGYYCIILAEIKATSRILHCRQATNQSAVLFHIM